MSKKARNSHKSKVAGPRSSCTQSDVPNCAQQKSGTKVEWAISQRFLISFLILNFAFFIFQSCGLDIEDPTPPDPPQWVAKSLPEEWPERGIDAHESGGIYLEWESNASQQISAYEIYRAGYDIHTDEQSAYVLLKRIETESLLKNEFLDRTAKWEEKYSYRILCEDEAENRSDYSEEQSYTIIPDIYIRSGYDLPLKYERTLSWIPPFRLEYEDYVITLLTLQNNLLNRVQILPTNYTGLEEKWRIPDSTILNNGDTYKWRIDVGSSYIDGKETVGAESEWAYFRYE